MRLKISIPVILAVFLLSSCEKDDQNIENIKFYGDVRDDMGYSIAAGNDGLYICGQLTEVFRENGNHITGSVPRVGLVKTDFEGNMIWKKFLGGDLSGKGTKVIVANDSSVICAGQVTDPVSSKTNIYVAKVDGDGTILEENIVEEDNNQTSTDIVQTSSGFLLLGTTDGEIPNVGQADSAFNLAGHLDLFLVPLTNTLDYSTPLQWGYPWDDRAAALKTDRNNGFIIAGTTDRHANKGRKNDVFLLRINEAASIKEPVILNSKADEYASDLEVLSDGYLVAGTTGSGADLQKPWFAHLPFNIQDTVYYPLPYSNTVSWKVNAIARYRNNFFIAAGRSGPEASSDMLFFILDEWGNISDGNQVISGSQGIQTAIDVISDTDNSVIATGINNNENNSMISFFKFRF
jgi:hypothetical protein